MVRNAAHEMKARMRLDLRNSRKARRTDEAKLIGALLAAIDNAEAPPIQADNGSKDGHRFFERSAEIERLALGSEQLQAILLAEIQERASAADEMERVGRPDIGERLRADALFAKRYID